MRARGAAFCSVREVLASLERIHHIDEPGTAQTAYSGNRAITTYRPNTPADFELRDMSRGGGIFTYDCFNTADYDIAQVPTQHPGWRPSGT